MRRRKGAASVWISLEWLRMRLRLKDDLALMARPRELFGCRPRGRECAFHNLRNRKLSDLVFLLRNERIKLRYFHGVAPLLALTEAQDVGVVLRAIAPKVQIVF